MSTAAHPQPEVTLLRSLDALEPIDPFATLAGPGRYEDDLVVVQRWPGAWPRRARGSVRTTHFDVAPCGGRLLVTHCVRREEIDDDLTGVVADELFGPGWVRGSEMFERIFTGVVRTMTVDAVDGWELFYRNTLRRLDEPRTAWTVDGHDAIDGYAPVYDEAIRLTGPGSVLELGSCFGFLALRLARRGHRATATDISSGTMRLLAMIAPRLGIELHTVLADAARLPLEDAYADTVHAIHLLEHLDPHQGTLVVQEAVRCARRRVIVAVPLEVEAEAAYGHVRTVSLDDLRAWGRLTGLPYRVSDHHGGWLVIDRP